MGLMGKAKDLGDGAAFARPGTEFWSGDNGMTLRAYIATACLQGLLARRGFGNSEDVVVKDAVIAADALLEELAR